MEIIQTLMHPHAWMAFFTLIFFEIMLNIDNMVFLSVTMSKLPQNMQRKGRVTGLLLGMLVHIGLLFGIAFLMKLSKPIFDFRTSWLSGSVSGESLIVFLGGLFLLYKSVSGIHQNLEKEKRHTVTKSKATGFWSIVGQFLLLNIIFSLDSVLTDVGVVSFKEFGYAGGMAIMILGVVAASLLLLLFSGPITKFIEENSTIQMLAMSFLILIGGTLIVEAAQLSHIVVWGKEVNEIPRGYVYFAIIFALFVEILNMQAGKRRKKRTKHP